MKRTAERISAFILVLALWSGIPSAGAGEGVFPWIETLRSVFLRSLQTVLRENDNYPKMIDRWTDPEAYSDFAFSPEDDLLEIWFPRIRDRDAAIFLYQGECWMLDCSDEQAEERVVPLLKALGIEKIDRIINTHPHHDHLNGFYAVDAAAPVSELMICFPRNINEHMIKAVEYAREQRIRVTSFADEQVLLMGDGVVRFLAWMKSGPEESMNDQSAQFMVSYGSCDALFMADIEWRGQEQLYSAVGRKSLRADILRYPHHGKKGMVDKLFRAISPEMAVFTATEGSPEVRESTRFFEYYYPEVVRAYTTRGYLHLTTDGKHWLCEKVDDETLFGGLEGVDAPAMRWRNE